MPRCQAPAVAVEDTRGPAGQAPRAGKGSLRTGPRARHRGVASVDGLAATRLWEMQRGAYLLNLGPTPYGEAWDLQRALAAAVSQGAIPDTVVLLEHPPVITLGRRTDEGAEMHVPDSAEVEVVETDRGGKSTFHGPGQLVCYPILDLNRHGRDVKRYVRDLEESVIRTVGAFELDATRIEGLTGVWLERPAAQGLLDRRAHRALGDDTRLRAQRRPRPGPVYGVDHGLRARGRRLHDPGARARPAGHGRRGAPARCGGARGGLRTHPRGAPSRGRHRPRGPSRSTRRSRRSPPAPPPIRRRSWSRASRQAPNGSGAPKEGATGEPWVPPC